MMRDRMALIDKYPPCKLDDEELGLAPLLRIMPDTWKNIPWVM